MSTIEFVNYNKIEDCFKKNNFDSFFNDDVSLIASISDILHLTEQYKKDNLNISHDQLLEKHNFFINNCNVFVPEIDRITLLENMFEEDEESFCLWEKACNKKISPRFSISLISLKNNQFVYWNDSNVFEEMEEFYLNFESYE